MPSTRYPYITEVEPLGDGDAAVLRDVRDVLSRHGALERFGLTLLHEHFDLREGEILAEETNVSERSQQMRPVLLDDLVGSRTVETSWAFEPDSGDVTCLTVCWNYPDGAPGPPD